MRTESSGEERGGVGFFYEQQLSREKVFECYQLFAANVRVGYLLGGKLYVDREAVAGAGALVARLHDALAASGYHHEPLFGDLFGELLGRPVLAGLVADAVRTEHHYLFHVPVSGEYLKGVSQLFQQAVHQLYVHQLCVVPRDLYQGGEHLAEIF